jgi:hypothetical protein
MSVPLTLDMPLWRFRFNRVSYTQMSERLESFQLSTTAGIIALNDSETSLKPVGTVPEKSDRE